jgi:uncharacterized protein (TIGR02996 family)
MPSERDALYAAILANPDDDTVRLAFADHLEENGDAKRAQYIREQIELAGLREWDERYIQLLRKRELFKGISADPFRPRSPEGLPWDNSGYRRGFAWAVSANTADAFVDGADAVCALGPVQSLCVADVYHQFPHTLKSLSRNPALGRLRRLQFISSQVNWQAAARLGDSPHATGLHELECRLGALGSRALCTLLRSPLLPRLNSLHITGAQLGASFASTLARLPATNELRSLTLRDIELAPGVEEFVNAPALGGLTSLRVENLGPATAAAVLDSPLMNHLESLTLGDSGLQSRTLATLAANPASENLRRLDLSSNFLDETAVATLAESPYLRNLRVLVLQFTAPTPESIRAIARSPHLAGLLHLDLGDCGVDDVGAAALLDSPLATTLLRLDLTTKDSRRLRSGDTRQRLKQKMGVRVQL